jgi:uncharacterized protein (DUF1800 family)
LFIAAQVITIRPGQSPSAFSANENESFALGTFSRALGWWHCLTEIHMPKHLYGFFLALVGISIVAAGCAGGTASTPPPAGVSVTTSPGAANVRAGDSQTFSASVSGTANQAVTWSVNGIAGGNSTLGLIDAAGKYTAPNALPSPNNVSVQAASVANPAAQGASAVTLLNPIPVVTAINPTTIGIGGFTLVVTGSKFVRGATVLFGGAPLATTFVTSTELAAAGTATASQVGTVNVTVQNPDPGAVISTTSRPATVTSGQVATAASAVRFLEQSTFGPTPVLINQVEQTGFSTFLNDQFAAPASTYPDPDPTVTSLGPTQQVFFTNALTGPDQLRQRVAFALSQIWVTSGNTIPPQGMAPYMRLLLQDALTNYRTLMADVTLSPTMGRYLDMVNNDKPDPVANTHANENYARELMQLFTLGLYLTDQSGALQRDTGGNPIPTYDQTAVQNFARAFTGWTYPTQPGNTLQKHNPVYWLGPMEALDSNHDVASKALLRGVTLPANQTSLQDLNAALDNLFNHPNLAPFVSKQLIQHLVTSNPSAAYIRRVADVFVSGSFASFGSGQRGDMKALIAAILLDPEARRGDDPTTANAADGHLREPILYIANLLRAFAASSDGAAPVNFASSLAQPPLRSPSVFNFFPPDFLIPSTDFPPPAPVLLGPEFDIQTTAISLARINFVNSYVFGSLGAGTTVDFTPFANISASPDSPGQLLDTLNTLMLHGTLSSSSRASILAAVNAVPGPSGASQNLLRAKTAIYLIASSSQYQVEQ